MSAHRTMHLYFDVHLLPFSLNIKEKKTFSSKINKTDKKKYYWNDVRVTPWYPVDIQKCVKMIHNFFTLPGRCGSSAYSGWLSCLYNFTNTFSHFLTICMCWWSFIVRTDAYNSERQGTLLCESTTYFSNYATRLVSLTFCERDAVVLP